MDLLWVVIAAGLVFLMQVGFLCLESGLVRSKNSINVAAKNVTDFIISSSMFGLVGFGLMFGASHLGIVGSLNVFIASAPSADSAVFFIFQMMFCGTAATLVSGAVAERMNYLGYILATLLITVCIYPIVGHWVWGGLYSGEAVGWLEQRGFVDFAGSTVVHSVGGWVALAALIILGPRLGRFSDGSRRIPGSNIPLAAMGALIIWFGWIGFNGGSTLEWSNEVPLIILNTFTAACWGGIGATLIRYVFKRYIDLIYTLNGVVGGLVAVTALCHIITPLGALLVGFVAGLIVYAGDLILERLKIDDVIGVIPAHLLAGIWGTLAVAIFATDPELTTLAQFGVQLSGVITIAAYSFVVAFFGLTLLNRIYPLRVEEKAELDGLNVAEHRVSTEVFDLLSAMDSQRRNSDFQKHIPVEPYTEIGQIAQLYNQVIDQVNAEMLEKDQAFSAYKQSEFRHGAILDAAIDSIVTVDGYGTILQMNKAAEKTFYVTMAKMSGIRFFDAFLFENDYKRALISLYSGFTETEGFLLLRRNRVLLKRSDGSSFPAELVVTKTTSDDKPNEEYTLYIRDIARRIKLEERLKALAYQDPLTNLFNRAYFMSELKERISRRSKNGGDVAVFFLDLDGFKLVNDTLGHKAGDMLLCEVARRLQKAARADDLVGRWGGDEFVVFLSGTLSHEVVAERAQFILEALRPSFEIENKQISVKASVGVAVCSGAECNEDDILQNADIAMYEAKQAGKDTFRFFDEAMLTNTQNYFNLENALPLAIRENQFYLVYQPKLSLITGKINGFEALIRWDHPEMGAMSPAEFIPILESSSLIIDLDEWVINEVFSELAELSRIGINDMPIAVNISGKHLGEGGLIEYIAAKARFYGVPANMMEVEITEGVLIGDSPTSVDTINSLAHHGMKLYIDDFGTGYSSLSYLSKFPISVLKIDRVFIKNCTLSEEDSAICLAIIALAKGLNLEIVAEGVETKAQLDFLVANNCDAYQGYYYSKPVTRDQMTDMLKADCMSIA